MKTIGISPKLTAATIAAVVSYLLGQTILELPPLVVVLLQVVLVAGTAYRAPAGTVLPVQDGPLATREVTE